MLVGNWAIPDIVVAFTSAHIITAVFFQDLADFPFILSHATEPARSVQNENKLTQIQRLFHLDPEVLERQI